jgi:hypothetical protein
MAKTGKVIVEFFVKENVGDFLVGFGIRKLESFLRL